MKLLVKKIMILLMWYPLRIVVRYLPLKLTCSLAVAGGQVLYLISREKHRVMAGELRRIIPGRGKKEIDGIVKKSFINYCVSEIEVLLYPSMDRKYIEKNVSIEGKEHLDNALSKGKGVLLFQAHFGAFQMTMPAVGYSGYAMNQISASASVWKEESASEAQKKMFDIKARHEYTLPVKHISVTSSLRPLFNALKANEIVGITVDGGGGKKVLPMRFLGRGANFQTGAADIAVSTGAEIVPAFIISEKGLKHRMIIHKPYRTVPGLGKDENRKNILQSFASLLEEYVYNYPEHYGYTLCLRRMRALLDEHPFFEDYNMIDGEKNMMKAEGEDYA
jgi:KDO2-lipid IV(A) lauroyltransferase